VGICGLETVQAKPGGGGHSAGGTVETYPHVVFHAVYKKVRGR